MKNIDRKKELVKNLSEKLRGATSIVFINYSGMDVKTQTELKKRLKAVGGQMLVAKNTLLKLAGQGAGIDEKSLDDEVLSGQTALVVSREDPVSPIQVLGKFIKEFEVPEFKVGVVENDFQNKEALVKISSLPSKEALQAQVVGTIGAPLYGLVGTLNSKMQELLYVLDEASKKGGEK